MESVKTIDLSIIIPHFNTPDLLERLLNSIPWDKNIQILVIDDNSDKYKSEYENVIRKWKKTVEFLKNDRGVKGAGTCRNIGLTHAKGNWILFADADDFFLDGMYEVIEQFFGSNYEVIYFVPTSVDVNTGIISNRHEVYEKAIKDYINNQSKENLLKLKSKPHNTPWSKLFSREFIEKYKIRFSEVLHSNDIMFLAKAGCYSNNIYASLSKIYCVTRGSGSLTTCISWKSFWQRTEEYIRTCLVLKEFYKNPADIRALQLTGAGTIYRAFQNHYGIRKYIQLILAFKRNNIPIISFSTMSLHYLYVQIKKYHKDRRMTKAYLTK